jgi:L-seryl-tRNA(Ser) seleniumtransferase
VSEDTTDIYTRLGVRRLINAQGTVTALGGSRIAPEVLSAMAEASRHFVSLDALQEQAGAHIARLLGVEAAYVSAGAAAGLTLATAACIVGDDPALVQRLPDTAGIPHLVAIHRSHRNGYDQAIRQAGAEFVEFGWIKETAPWQLEAALDEEPVAVAYFVEFAGPASLPLETVVYLAHRRGVPVIVDAAAELPPVANLHAYCDDGADLAVFSGGKDICGPQASGLIVGDADLIRRCALNANPHYSVGRPAKVGKEEIVGLLVALEQYLAQDEMARQAQWGAQVAHIVAVVRELPGVRAWQALSSGPGIRPVSIPRAFIEWDEAALGVSVPQAVAALRAGEPGVVVHATTGTDPVLAPGSTRACVLCNPQTLDLGEEEIVARRLKDVLGG